MGRLLIVAWHGLGYGWHGLAAGRHGLGYGWQGLADGWHGPLAVPRPGLATIRRDERTAAGRGRLLADVTGEDALMQKLQFGPGLDAKFGHETAADLPEHGERLGPLAGQVPGRHEHPGEALVQRVAGQRRGQLGGGLPFSPAGEHARQAVLQHRQALLGQPVPDRCDPLGVRRVSQRRAVPERQRGIEQRDGGGPLRRTCRPAQRPGPLRVDQVLVEFEQVPVTAAGQRSTRKRLEQPPQPGHQGLQAGPRRPGRLVLPDGVDEFGHQHDLTDTQHHQAKDEAQLRARWHLPGVTRPEPYRPEHPHHDVAPHKPPPRHAARVSRSSHFRC